jgi:Kef-type K+ transport system membrane component KefB
MTQTVETLFAIGGILLLGLATDYLGRRTVLPRVTLLMLFGILIGDEALALIPATLSSRFELIATLALMMVGFLLGGKLTASSLRQSTHQLLWISLSAALGTTLIVTLALVTVGVAAEIAILLGCIAAATAPAATLDTVLESGTQSRFSRLLLAIVAVDDAWAVIIFSLGLALVSLLMGTQDAIVSISDATAEIGGAILLGAVVGLPAAYLTGRLAPGQPMLMEALGLVFICGAAALALEVSFLIAVMVMGAVIANLAKHHEYPFHEIENIEWPFLVVFFVLAGASLEIDALLNLGVAGVVYIIARAVGKLSGARLGAAVSRSDPSVQRWLGLALLPQAGVAVGMALLAIGRFPEFRHIILPVVIGTTVVFELVGPVCTRAAIRYSDETEMPE